MYLKPSSLSLALSEGLNDEEHVLYWPGDHSETVTLFRRYPSLPTGLKEVASFEIYHSIRQDFLSYASSAAEQSVDDGGGEDLLGDDVKGELQ